VLLVVMPSQDSESTQDPTTPTLSADMLGRIEESLAASASPFVRLHVVNPIYVRIQVTAKVSFRDEAGAGSSIERLNDDLIGYLSPWSEDPARTARGADYASEADISEFVQTRPYVASMTSIAFAYAPAPATLAWYFLTSAAAHRIIDLATSTHPPRGGY
jgi:hypothetical protein